MYNIHSRSAFSSGAEFLFLTYSTSCVLSICPPSLSLLWLLKCLDLGLYILSEVTCRLRPELQLESQWFHHWRSTCVVKAKHLPFLSFLFVVTFLIPLFLLLSVSLPLSDGSFQEKLQLSSANRRSAGCGQRGSSCPGWVMELLADLSKRQTTRFSGWLITVSVAFDPWCHRPLCVCVCKGMCVC